VWPDTGRLERTRRAIDLARHEDLLVERGDALAVVPDVVRALPGSGVVCLLTTWAFGYFPPDDRHAFVDLLTTLGRERPLVWIAGDEPGVVDDVVPGPTATTSLPADGGERSVLSAVRFDGGALEKTTLAVVQPHGRWLHWEA
jgi:hypothetical protein